MGLHVIPVEKVNQWADFEKSSWKVHWFGEKNVTTDWEAVWDNRLEYSQHCPLVSCLPSYTKNILFLVIFIVVLNMVT
jgi:hypothetical protein